MKEQKIKQKDFIKVELKKMPDGKLAALKKLRRELEIEAALEKVRSRTMAMQKSDELSETVFILFQQFKQLGENPDQATIGIMNEDEWVIEYWVTMYGNQMNRAFKFSIDEPNVTNKIYKGWKEQKKSLAIELSGKELREFAKYRESMGGAKYNPREKHRIINVAFFSKGLINVQSNESRSAESVLLLERFAKVFEQTYTRFLDLQKAEAQAREAQIETALERVRSRSMGMQKSEELKEVIQVVYEQFVHLNILVEHAGFIMDYKERNDMFIWLADKHAVPSQVTIPYFDSAHWNSFNEAKEKGIKFFTTHLSFEEKNKFYQDLFKLFPVPDEAKEYYFTCPGLAGSTVLLENVSLYIENFSGNPFTDEENAVLMRFGKVFQQTYTRFLDLQKAEAQAREAQIELGLERVRARAMAMQKSDELKELIGTVFTELTKLDLALTRTVIWIFDAETNGTTWWMANSEDPENPMDCYIPYSQHPPYLAFLEQWEKRSMKFQYELKGENKKNWDDYLFSKTGLARLPGIVIEGMKAPEKVWLSASFNNFGAMNAASLDPLSDEHFDILLRFAKVFDLTYTRFNDLKQAEAQAREATIEAALERVRSKTMGMHKSTDLLEVISVLSEQFLHLGFKIHSANFNTSYREKDWNLWLYNPGTPMFPDQIYIPYLDNPFFNRTLESIANGSDFTAFVFTKEEKDGFLDHLYSNTIVKNTSEERKRFAYDASGFAWSTVYLKNTALTIANYDAEPYTEEQNAIIRRFGNVFEQSYTRFLDLQKAETQAREAQIQLALERVRARTMAMQKQNDLLGVLDLFVEQLVKLGVNLQVANFSDGLPGGDWDLWIEVVAEGGTIFNNYVHFPRVDHPYFHHVEKNIETFRKDGTDLFKDVFSKEEKDSWQDYINTQTIYKDLTSEEIRQSMYEKPGYAWSMVILKDTWVSICRFNTIPFSDEEDALLRRFANAFGQTYTRFLDLQKAEAQSREAQIEAALERVRSRTMAMQNSDELADLVATVFRELNRLEFALTSCIIWINNPEFLTAEMWVASTEMNKPPEPYYIKPFRHPYFKSIIDAWKQKNKKWVYEMNGEEKKIFQQLFFDEVGSFPTLMKNALEAPESVIYSASFYNFGALEIIGTEHVTDEKFEILHRLGKVFDMSYTRFTDLKQAEAQAREATIEAALERVRSRTMAMQKSDELAETSLILFRQLIHLGIAPNRLYIGVTNDKNTDIEFWITDEDGSKVSTLFSGDAFKNISIKKMYDGWKQQKKSIVIDMQGKELDEYFHYPGNELRVPFQGDLSQKRRIQYISYFSKGFIGMASPDEQPEKTVLLLDRFAAVFNLTFTRFNDLKVAEVHAIQAEQDLIEIKASRKKAEDALSELKATQKQLIQSEKMASLGELTAGIAHEIQNPLNFVNNFSEVNKELLEELKAEHLKPKAERDEQTEDEIINDVIGNSEKINHHGKRAGDIVKGMLQHSRTSTGQKEPTDINALADEYLRLSYHGLRAKDKSFNAEMKTDFDEAIGKINIIPQDIGRVLLNLFNNAFYACAERSRSTVNARLNESFGQEQKSENSIFYEPTVSVKTQKVNNHVTITVSDNGNGIPKNIVDKIFQPFFTTKPTGEGTGLGLSLSYDIIKAHGGEIKMETKEARPDDPVGRGEGTEFIIQLPI